LTSIKSLDFYDTVDEQVERDVVASYDTHVLLIRC